MEHPGETLLFGLGKTVFLCALIYTLGNTTKFKGNEEFKVAGIGCMIFMFISWAVIFIAQINPFIEPEFTNDELFE